MKGYVIDKDWKVVEQRGNITRAQLDEGCTFVISFDKPPKVEGLPTVPYAVGEKLAGGLSKWQIVGILTASRGHLTNGLIHSK